MAQPEVFVLVFASFENSSNQVFLYRFTRKGNPVMYKEHVTQGTYINFKFSKFVNLRKSKEFHSSAVSSVLILPRLKRFNDAPTNKTYSIKAVTPAARHGEGPHWDERNQILYYVDTFLATVYRWNYQTKRISSHKLDNHNSVGVIVPIEGEKNQFLVGADRNLCRINWPKGLYRQTPEMSILGRVEVEKPKNQFNDGKVDSRGRMWIGTLTRNEDLSVLPKGGSLYMIKYGDTIEEEEKISNTSISNGIAWSNDNKKFYFVDSMPRTVTEYDYEEESGKISNGKIIFDLANHPELEGIPDGMTIDNKGNLWIALFKGHSVINVDPNTGEILNRIKMPVTYPTSVCFGGPQLDVLFVTTSREHLDEKQLREEPEAGSVFVVENLGVQGFPGNRAVSFS